MGQLATFPENRPSGPGSQRRGRGFTLLSPHFLDELRVRVTLSAVVGRTVPLKKAGNEFKACCPFHQEKTPSFWVNDLKGFYHCFGCGAHGDAIRWLTEACGLQFLDAVGQLAEQAGMALPKPEPEEIERQKRAASLHDVLEAAAKHYHLTLHQFEGSAAREYLKAREITDEAVGAFRIGFAPDGRGELEKGLPACSRQQLIDSGLLISIEEKEPYDRFRNRVMVPIKDPRGRVIAFGGRILGAGEPKYLNSPDTPVFDKGRILFNLDRAAPASRQTDRLIVVEGYFDVIALDQVGIREAVAPMGTALTEAQLEQLWRLVDEPILCFDGDAAGQKAAARAAERAMPSVRPGKQLRLAILPSGQDPDDLVRQGGRAAFEAAIDAALPLSRFLYEAELQKIDPQRPEQRANLRKSLDDLAKSAADRFVGEEFARSFAGLFFEDFGWKAKQRRLILGPVIRTAPRRAPDLARLYVRSALYGLTRFPAVAAANLDEVGALPVVHPELCRWRDGITEAILLQPDLDSDGIKALLEVNLLPQTVTFDVTSDLRFGFTRRDTPPETAMRQLESLVGFLARERALKDQFQELDEAAGAALTDDEARFVAIEAARQQLREARASLLENAANWDDQLT